MNTTIKTSLAATLATLLNTSCLLNDHSENHKRIIDSISDTPYTLQYDPHKTPEYAAPEHPPEQIPEQQPPAVATPALPNVEDMEGVEGIIVLSPGYGDYAESKNTARMTTQNTFNGVATPESVMTIDINITIGFDRSGEQWTCATQKIMSGDTEIMTTRSLSNNKEGNELKTAFPIDFCRGAIDANTPKNPHFQTIPFELEDGSQPQPSLVHF